MSSRTFGFGFSSGPQAVAFFEAMVLTNLAIPVTLKPPSPFAQNRQKSCKRERQPPIIVIIAMVNFKKNDGQQKAHGLAN